MKFKILIILLIGALSLNAINENAGTSGFNFLKMNFSARASAMGNAYTGLSNDANAVFYNPAGLVQIKSPQASATYMNYIENINCGAMVCAFPRDEYATYAIFLKGLTTNETRELADENGDYAGPDGTFGMSNFVVGLSFGRYINDILDIGINVKYIQESLDDKSASALAFDFAIMHQTTQKHLKLGIAFRNVGKQISYHTSEHYEENLPRVFAVGFNYNPIEELTITFDINKPLDNDFTGNLGIEYFVHPMLALRGGYKSNAEDWRTGGDAEIFSGASCGLGFNLRNINFDYAVVSFGDLGILHHLTLNYLF